MHLSDEYPIVHLLWKFSVRGIHRSQFSLLWWPERVVSDESSVSALEEEGNERKLLMNTLR